MLSLISAISSIFFAGVDASKISRPAGHDSSPERVKRSGCQTNQRLLNKKLIFAVIHSDAKEIKTLCKRGADVNVRLDNGQPLLIFALPKATIGALLLQLGASPNCRDKDLDSPLHVVARSDIVQPSALRTQLVKLLCIKGAMVDSRNKQGATPLDLACEIKESSVVACLLSFKANPNSRDNYLRTPLMYAARADSSLGIADHLITIGLLLKSDARIDDVDFEGRSAEDFAMEMHNEKVESALRIAASFRNK